MKKFSSTKMVSQITWNPSVLIVLLLILASFSSTYAQTLVWQEHFDDATLNPDAWTYDFGNGSERAAGYGWGNSELEYYTSRPENVRTEGGSLLIEARKENFDGSAYTSGRIKTEGRVHFKYGTVEARIKLPNMANGLWPAFWTLGTIGPSWPGIGEIDIMEAGSSAAIAAGLTNKQISSAFHWSNAEGAHQYHAAHIDATVDLSADYHLYKMVWTSQYIKLFLDNVEYFSFDISSDPTLSEFHTPHFLLLNLAVGGQYTGIFAANGITAPLPGKLYVDYVKLYQNPGDELIITSKHAPDGNFGVLTETRPVSDSLTFGTNASLYYWHNLTNIVNPVPVPYEGNHLLAVHANANDWFGMGVDNNYVNLVNFGTGSLKFHFKTTYTGQFKIGLKSGHGESWINFAAGASPFGLVRDGNWHEIEIPLSVFSNSAQGRNIDLPSIKAAFMFAGDPAIAAADFYFDDIYFSGGISRNPAPTVAITSPSNHAIFPEPANITIDVDAADANGTITKVDFYSGKTWIGSDATAPYSFTWNNPPAGVDTLTAKATDNEGSEKMAAPVIVFVSNPGNNAPSTVITSPADNATFLTPQNIIITANASDGDGSIYKVEFFKDGELIGSSTTSPYSYTWTGAPAGNYNLTVKATDNGGLTTTSTVVHIMVTNPIKPTVSITSPANNSKFEPPASIVITADAADANGTITKVEFYNGTVLIGTDLTSPFSYTWDAVPLGEYIITAKATDNDGNSSLSAPINISVAPVSCTGTAVNGDYSYEVYTEGGTVYFTFHPLAPITGSNSAIIYLKEGGGGYPGYGMTASGADFKYSKAIGNGTSTSFYFTYHTPPAGERNSSANPHSYVVGTVCVAGAPTVSITSPLEAANFTAPANITINATAADSDGAITKVEFYNGSTFLGEDLTSPYSFTWNNVTAGPYILKAKAIDNSLLTTTSAPVNIIVNSPNTNGYCGTAFNGDYEYKAETTNGIVTITLHPLTPITGSQYALIYVREGISGGYPGYGMTAAGTDFVFSKTIANGTPVSFYFTYQTPPAGERNSAANPHSYTVGDNCSGATGTPPMVNITTPANNASYTEPATITIKANATDNDGTISKLEFYHGATLIGMDDSSPYSVDWINAPAGNYNLTVKATDNNGLTTISSIIKVAVNISYATGYCGTVGNGDYSYKAETINGEVVFSFHPLNPIEGCAYALIYVKEGSAAGYPGYQMTSVGTDFRFTKTIASGTPLSIYFTYHVPGQGDRNSSATPHNYTAGAVCTSVITPVTLLNFSATRQKEGSVSVKWSTTNELNNDHFVIERSSDGRTFFPIAQVKANINAESIKEYSFTDKNPVKGPNYYRLLQVDNNGKKASHGVRLVNIGEANISLSLYPNPLKGTRIYIKMGEPSAIPLPVRIIDARGAVFSSGLYTQQGDLLIVNLPGKLVSGIYIIKVEGHNPLKLIVN